MTQAAKLSEALNTPPTITDVIRKLPPVDDHSAAETIEQLGNMLQAVRNERSFHQQGLDASRNREKEILGRLRISNERIKALMPKRSRKSKSDV